jgi:Zn-dependent peptidase ImmA (M78 family)
LSRDRLDHLFQHCADLGIDVEWADLGPIRHGQYRATTGVITLNIRLTRRRSIAALGHELGHREFGDTCSTPLTERRAWEYAAALLVTPAEYRQAEERVGHHVADLAAELEVTTKVIEAWRRWWETRGRQRHRRCCAGQA